MADQEIDISKYDKAEILSALYNNSRQQGLGFLNARGKDPLSVDDARELLKKSTYFDYLAGRVLKIDLSGDTLYTGLYNRDVGFGAAEEIIASLTTKQPS